MKKKLKIIYALCCIVLIPLFVVICFLTYVHIRISKNEKELLAVVYKASRQDKEYSTVDNYEIDRITFTSKEWFTATYLGISHSGSFIEDLGDDVSIGLDSHGKTYISYYHFCDSIRLDINRRGPYKSITDYLQKNPEIDWQPYQP